MRRVSANIPKFTRIEAQLREVTVKQRAICTAIDVALEKRHAEHKKRCLATVRSDCEEALRLMHTAIHHLYEAFEDPKSQNRPVMKP